MEQGVECKLKDIKVCTETTVGIQEQETQKFLIRDGLKQGGVLSPTLFAILMDAVTK